MILDRISYKKTVKKYNDYLLPESLYIQCSGLSEIIHIFFQNVLTVALAEIVKDIVKDVYQLCVIILMDCVKTQQAASLVMQSGNTATQVR